MTNLAVLYLAWYILLLAYRKFEKLSRFYEKNL